MRRLPRWTTRLRWTVRLKLTLVIGGLIVACGVGLLGFTYLLMSRSVVTFENGNGMSVSISRIGADDERGPVIVQSTTDLPPGQIPDAERLSPDQLREQGDILRQQALEQRSAQLRQFLVQSGIALAVLAVVSVLAGWYVAGRLLRRLRTITTAAQDISATNLHRRLDFHGPQDELKELGDTFDALLARLEGSFAAQRQFVANASHELRTPLARQRALGQVALADPEASTGALRAAHERILVAGAQQEHLIDALLTLARGQAGFAVSTSFDLAGLTGEVVEARQGDAAARGITLTGRLDPATVAGDARLTERLVVNLVDNAVRHNHSGGSAQVETRVRDGVALLIVTNTGPEVAADAVPDLFQPFTRLGTQRIDQSTSQSGGLGLGLSIVRAIAEAHDATVEAQPRAGGGLVVTVTFRPAPREP